MQTKWPVKFLKPVENSSGTVWIGLNIEHAGSKISIKEHSNQVCTTQLWQKSAKKCVFTHLTRIMCRVMPICLMTSHIKTRAFIGSCSHTISGLCSLTLSYIAFSLERSNFFSAYTTLSRFGSIKAAASSASRLRSADSMAITPELYPELDTYIANYMPRSIYILPKYVFTTCTNPIIHLFYPPKICIGVVFDFSWDIFMSQEKLQAMIIQKCWG